MKLVNFLPIAVVLLFATSFSSAQMEDHDVDGLAVEHIDYLTQHLSWKAAATKPCEFGVTYSIFRDTKADFAPSDDNRIASELTLTDFVVHEPQEATYYYRVRAVKKQSLCAPEVVVEPGSMASGLILTNPLDLDAQYAITLGDKSGNCKATSTRELDCGKLKRFHAVIATQGTHDYLIGCQSLDFGRNNMTCVDLGTATYKISVHSRSLTVLDAGFVQIDPKSGKELSSVTPELSILAQIK